MNNNTKELANKTSREIIKKDYVDGNLACITFRNVLETGEVIRTKEFYLPNGTMFQRTYQDETCRVLHSVSIPSSELFNNQGRLLSVTYSPTEQQVIEYLDSNNKELVLEKSYHHSGSLKEKISVKWKSVKEWGLEKTVERYNSSGYKIFTGCLFSI